MQYYLQGYLGHTVLNVLCLGKLFTAFFCFCYYWKSERSELSAFCQRYHLTVGVQMIFNILAYKNVCVRVCMYVDVCIITWVFTCIYVLSSLLHVCMYERIY